MNIAMRTAVEMLEAVKAAIFSSPSQVIRFKDSSGNVLCTIAFDALEVNTSVANEYYFKSAGSAIIRGLANITGGTGTVSECEIDDVLGVMINATVGLPNSGSDITFNETLWNDGQLVLISELKFILPTRS